MAVKEQMGTIQVVTGYRPRVQQAQIHLQLRKHRFGAAVCHRRFGKTVLAVNHLIDDALRCEKPRPRYGYLAPTYRQAKSIAWDYLKHYTSGIPGRKVNESELWVTLPGDRQVRLYGADNPDSLRGIYLDGVVLDEYGLMASKTFPEVIRPALSDRLGWAFFIGTPNGKNQFWDVCKTSLTEDGWFFAEHKASQTGIIPQGELELARKTMTQDEYDQEFECSFEASVKGAVFATEIRRAEEEGRILKFPYEKEIPVDTYWDLGVGDSTAIWFVQQHGTEIRLLDYYENSGQGLDHYAAVLRQKPYSYRRHVGPHDLTVKELGSGKTRWEMAEAWGIYFEICPKLPLEDGINASRQVFSRCYFNVDKCERGVEALKNYKWDFNSRIDEFKATPVHDWASHGADAFRTMTVMISRKNQKPVSLVYSNKGIV